MEQELSELQAKIVSAEDAMREQAVRKELIMLEEQEQRHWHHKSRIQWYVEGG